ncbi:TetR/AcrR family transcriptional regulator, partial [Saprospiraceae bacterium]|nr:TetR/AcrR family transcriptional regulator [Saprospiraceae bacterium]
ILHKIIVNEGSKAYHTANVDADNKTGMFLSYKELVENVAGIIGEINPDFPYKLSLASNMFEMSNNQIYFAEHLPRLTDIHYKGDDQSELLEMLDYYVFKLLS